MAEVQVFFFGRELRLRIGEVNHVQVVHLVITGAILELSLFWSVNTVTAQEITFMVDLAVERVTSAHEQVVLIARRYRGHGQRQRVGFGIVVRDWRCFDG